MNREEQPLIQYGGTKERLVTTVRKQLHIETSKDVIEKLKIIDCIGDIFQYVVDVRELSPTQLYIELRIPFQKLMSVPKKFWENMIGVNEIILMGWFSLP